MYDAGQVNAPPWDVSPDQHDPRGSRQHHVGRRAAGSAPDGFRYKDRDMNVHRDRLEQQQLPFPKFPGVQWKRFQEKLQCFFWQSVCTL